VDVGLAFTGRVACGLGGIVRPGARNIGCHYLGSASWTLGGSLVPFLSWKRMRPSSVSINRFSPERDAPVSETAGIFVDFCVPDNNRPNTLTILTPETVSTGTQRKIRLKDPYQCLTVMKSQS
jgi:hypothetical protein